MAGELARVEHYEGIAGEYKIEDFYLFETNWSMYAMMKVKMLSEQDGSGSYAFRLVDADETVQYSKWGYIFNSTAGEKFVESFQLTGLRPGGYSHTDED